MIARNRRVIVGSAPGESSAELTSSGDHEDAGPKKLSECCGDACGGGQDQGDAADHRQDLCRGHLPWPCTGCPHGLDAGSIVGRDLTSRRPCLPPVYSPQRRSGPARLRSAIALRACAVERGCALVRQARQARQAEHGIHG